MGGLFAISLLEIGLGCVWRDLEEVVVFPGSYERGSAEREDGSAHVSRTMMMMLR
jgi:hypothetical protein